MRAEQPHHFDRGYPGHTISNGAVTLAYDDAGRMVSATRDGDTTTYTYNGLGQKVKKAGPSGVKHLVYDELGHLLGVYDGTGVLVEEFAWFEDIPVATIRTNTSGGIWFFYIHTDHLNTPTRLTRVEDNAVMWRWDHDPYGAGNPDEDADQNGALVFFNLRFPGQFADVESGLYYNYFRDYDPQVGRYVQSDPIGLRAGINTYAYAGSDPIGGVDPLGLFNVTGYEVFNTDGSYEWRYGFSFKSCLSRRSRGSAAGSCRGI